MTVSYTQSRQFFPAVWTRGNVPANASLDIGISGQATIKDLPAASQSSVVTLVLAGSQVPTTGWVKAEITKDGALTGFSAQFGAATGTMRRIEVLAPGVLTFNKEHRIGVHLSSHPSLAPADIDVAVYLEIQPT